MKRERIQFLVTCSIGYTTRAERREAIAAAREDVLATSTGPISRPVRATLVKHPHLRPISLRKSWDRMEESRRLRLRLKSVERRTLTWRGDPR